MRDRLAQLQRAELADAVRTQLADLKLPVPLTVCVDLGTPLDQAPETHTEEWSTSAIDNAVAKVFAATHTPRDLPGTLLERAEAALRHGGDDTDQSE